MLYRHGRTAWNVARRFQGQLDVPLDEVGRAQAVAGARLLAGLQPDRLISSDLSRAADTAAELARLTGLPVQLDPALRETYGADWQGCSPAEIEERYPGALGDWLAGADIPVTGAETRTELGLRTSAALRRALDGLAPGATLVAVTHGGAARAAIGVLLGLPQQLWGVLGGLANCSWSVLEERLPVGEDTPGGAVNFRLVEHNAGALPEPVLGEEAAS